MASKSTDTNLSWLIASWKEEGYQGTYAKAYRESYQEGKQEQALSYTLMLLDRRLGSSSIEFEPRLARFSASELEELVVASLRFSNRTTWKPGCNIRR